MTRVAHLDREDLPEEFRGLFADLAATRGYVPSLYRALAHSPGLLREFVSMTAAIRSETVLDPKFRELAILGVALVTGAPTQWLAHLPLARAAGLTEEQIDGLVVWRRYPAFSAEERAVLAFAESVTREVGASREAWEGVRAFLSERECVELTLTVGFYNMVSRFLETVELDVDREYGRG